MRVSRLTVIVSLAAGCLAAGSASACSCREDDRPWSQVVAEADEFYIGTVSSVDVSSDDYESPHYGRLVTIEVERWWKGGGSERTQFLTGFGGGDCGVPAELGDTWLIEATKTDGGQLVSGMCHRTLNPEWTLDDPVASLHAALGNGVVPRSGSRWVLYLVLAFVATAGVATAWIVVRRAQAV